MEYSIPRLGDRFLFQYFIEEVFFGKEVEFSAELDNAIINIGDQDIAMDLAGELEQHVNYKLLKSIKETDGFSIQRISIGYKVQPVNRNSYNSSPTHTNIVYVRSSTEFVDKIIIQDNHKKDENLMAFIKMHAYLDKFHSYNSQESNDQVKSGVLSKLEGLSASLVESVHKHHLENIEENKKYSLSQKKYYKEKFDSELSKLNNTYNEKNEGLKKRELRLIDADNTTARRQVRNDIISSITPKAERFNFSKSVTNNIIIIGIICLLLAAFGIIVSGTSYFAIISGNLTKVDSTLWFHYIKSFSGAAIFLTSLTYFIRWLNNWTNRVANTELEYQKFERDLNRSHLAIEMCLEWKDKKDGAVPEQLLQAMTKDLFINKDDNQKYSDEHPVDQIASALVRSAEKIEIPIGTAMATTSGKSLKKQSTRKK